MRPAYFWLAFLLAALAAPTAPAQETEKDKEKEKAPAVDPAEWAPADALAFLGVTDTERLWTNIKKTTDYKMLEDKELAQSSGEEKAIESALDKTKGRLAKMLGVEVGELRSPLAGPLALHIWLPPGGRKADIDFGLIAAVGDAELMQKYFDTAVKNLKDTAKSYETASAGSHVIHVFAFEKRGEEQKEPGNPDSDLEDFGEEEPGAATDLLSVGSLPEKLAACLTKDRLIVAGSAERAKRLLARERDQETLATTDDYKKLLEALKPVGELRVLVNMPRVLELIQTEAEDRKEARKTIEVLGADSVRSVVGHARFGSKSYDSKMEMLFLMTDQRSGLAKLLSMDNQPVAPPATATAKTGIFASLNLDPPHLLDEILKMIAADDPAAAEAARAALGKVPMPDQGEPVNLRQDVIEPLAGPLTLAVGFSPPYGPGSMSMLLTLGHHNRDALARFVGRLPGMTPRELRGTTIYESPMSFGMAVALTSDQVMIGTIPAIEAALAGDQAQPLAEAEAFKTAAGLVPKEAWCTVFWDQRKVLEALAELSKKHEELGAEPFLQGLLSVLEMAGIDFSEVTPKTLSYARPGILAIATTSDGLRFTVIELKPKEE